MAQIDITKNEATAINMTMEAVGAAIEATGTTDLASMSVEQFASVIEAAFTGVAKNLQQLADDDCVPF